MIDNFEFLSSQVISSDKNTEIFKVDMWTELVIFLEITAQGTYTDETLNVTAQLISPTDDPYDDGAFDQIGDVTGSVPYRKTLKLTNFGGRIRLKLDVAGTAPSYTINITGYGKRDSV